jgi:hypothetical protein
MNFYELYHAKKKKKSWGLLKLYFCQNERERNDGDFA